MNRKIRYLDIAHEEVNHVHHLRKWTGFEYVIRVFYWELLKW
jgi:hypothetical protein